jgi:hypothetical protein
MVITMGRRADKARGSAKVEGDASVFARNPQLVRFQAIAERHWRSGDLIPEFRHRSAFVRPFARLLARGVLFLTRFLTAAQKQFNRSILALVYGLADELATMREEQRTRLEKIEKDLSDLRQQLLTHPGPDNSGKG